MKLLFILISIFISIESFAFIPKFKMIMSRTAENHGRGLYQITQDVIFSGENHAFVLTEKWLIKDENRMRVEVSGKSDLEGKFNLTFVYRDSTRYFIDQNGKKQSHQLSHTWMEPYFHFRYSKNIKSKLLSQGMVPASALKSKSLSQDIDEIEYQPEEYVRLGRSGGAITYAIGSKPKNNEKTEPGIWIEQDQFHVRKLRLESGETIVASDYNNYPRKLWLPKRGVLQSKNLNVQMLLLDVKPLRSNSKRLAPLEHSSLKVDSDQMRVSSDPELNEIIEFYKLYR